VVIATLQLHNFLQQSLQGIDQAGIAVALSDHTKPEQILPLVDNGTSADTIANLSHTKTIPFGGRNWQIRIQGGTAFLAGERGWQAWFVLASGALFTGLLGALLMLNHSRALRVQRLVDEQTRNVIREQQTLQIITDGALDAMLLLEPSGSIRIGNPAAQRLLKQSPDVLRGQALQHWLPALDSALLAQVSAAGSTGLRQETRLLLPDGDTRDVELALTAVPLADQMLFCCLIHDLTARLAVDKLKREFVSMVSHELRTPLTSIRGALALLRNMMENQPNDQQKQLLIIADDNSKRLLLLVNDLLDFEKLQLGKLTLNLTDANVVPLLERSVVELQPFARQQQVELISDIRLPAHCHALVDADRLVQVLYNLMSNAIKFSTARSKVVLVASAHRSQLRIDVIDHGIGIPAAQQANIFQKFWQADASSSRKHSGTGLGLAISQGLVQQMGGKLSFTSAEGFGTTFTIELPLPPASTAEHEPE
jgi:PAS domain S-box-containing protein